jgi:hypothetical protein
MYTGMSLRGLDLIPVMNSKIPLSLFFIGFVIIGNFFITNLFVGVVVSTFNREKEKLGNFFLLTEEQKKWLKTKLMLIKAKPVYF